MGGSEHGDQKGDKTGMCLTFPSEDHSAEFRARERGTVCSIKVFLRCFVLLCSNLVEYKGHESRRDHLISLVFQVKKLNPKVIQWCKITLLVSTRYLLIGAFHLSLPLPAAFLLPSTWPLLLPRSSSLFCRWQRMCHLLSGSKDSVLTTIPDPHQGQVIIIAENNHSCLLGTYFIIVTTSRSKYGLSHLWKGKPIHE